MINGSEIGIFHHEGSTYCLLFQAGVDVEFVKQADPELRKGKASEFNVRVYEWTGGAEKDVDQYCAELFEMMVVVSNRVSTVALINDVSKGQSLGHMQLLKHNHG